LLGLWVVIQLLLSVPALHHALHEDSASPGHHCLVTELASGHGIAPHTGLPVFRPPVRSEAPRAAVVSAPLHFSFRLPQAPRPPPALIVSCFSAGSARV
jgi:hypothetical protein